MSYWIYIAFFVFDTVRGLWGIGLLGNVSSISLQQRFILEGLLLTSRVVLYTRARATLIIAKTSKTENQLEGRRRATWKSCSESAIRGFRISQNRV